MSHQPHLLLAYHDQALREQLLRLLRESGYERITAPPNVTGVIDCLKQGAVDALVTDIPLGRLDGWRLARLVRSGVYPVAAELPVLVVSRHSSDRIAGATAREYEIDAFIPYPQRRGLVERLAECLRPGYVRKRPGLLVIEDDAGTQGLVEETLGGRFDIETAGDGESGLRAWRQRQHELILLDMVLPGKPGEEVLRDILAQRPSQAVVVMTGAVPGVQAGDLLLAGAVDFIAKPFQPERLRRVCDIALHREDYLRSSEQLSLRLAELGQEKGRAQVILESIGDGVISTDLDGRIEYLNPVAERLTGWDNPAGHGRILTEVFRALNPVTLESREGILAECLQEGRTIAPGTHSILMHKDGGEATVHVVASPIRNHNGDITGAVVVFHDISEAHRLGEQLSYQASHDSLTGLLNRREFERRLERLIEDSHDNGNEHVLCYLDLDQFKVINDTCGHAAGDALLRQVTAILQQHVRKRDTLARLGGDEFGVLLEYCDLDKARQVVDTLRQSLLDHRFKWGDALFTIGVSIGIVPLVAELDVRENPLGMADTACHLAKEAGRNRVHVYHSEDGELMRRHGEMQWVSRVTRAFEEDRFCLYHQPIMPVRPGSAGDHYELLIRMLDEQGEIVPPGFFLPAVERYDLATIIDRWVIRTALAWFAANPDSLARLELCSINLSGKSLSDEHFHDFVVDEFRDSPVPAEKICFEITETAAISHLDRAVQFIGKCKQLGCHFALDDFGSGMSSFGYLKNLPVDYLKIDGTFIKEIDKDPLDRTMVQAINDIGHVMGLKTIAEFVENAEIMRLLKEMGVDYVQGYHIAMPQPLAGCAAAIRKKGA